MAFRRVTESTDLLHGEQLTGAMTGIGMRFTTTAPLVDPNIEDTILAASIDGMVHDDLRVLSVLLTWVRIHHQWINVDRLTRAVSKNQSQRVLAFWASVAVWLRKDRRFSRLETKYDGPPLDLLRVGNEFQIVRRGEDPRFEGTCLRSPEGVLRDRISDVSSPSELVPHHSAYRHRVLMGPSYRADMWAVLEKDESISTSELARRVYGSYATAWQVKQDFKILAA